MNKIEDAGSHSLSNGHLTEVRELWHIVSIVQRAILPDEAARLETTKLN